jgi:hypothetical protein
LRILQRIIGSHKTENFLYSYALRVLTVLYRRFFAGQILRKNNFSHMCVQFPAAARRAVLFVADGLRAQSFYQPGASPFLHQVRPLGHITPCLLINDKRYLEENPGSYATVSRRLPYFNFYYSFVGEFSASNQCFGSVFIVSGSGSSISG